MEKKENSGPENNERSISNADPKPLKDFRAYLADKSQKKDPDFSAGMGVLLFFVGAAFIFIQVSMAIQAGWSGLGIVWASLFLLSFIGGFIGGLFRVLWTDAPRIGIVAAVLSLLWLLEFKVGAYNLWRDLIALLAALIVTVVLCKYVFPQIRVLFHGVEVQQRSLRKVSHAQEASTDSSATETPQTEKSGAETAAEQQPVSQKTDDLKSREYQSKFQGTDADQSGEKRRQTLAFAGRALLFFIIGWTFISIADDFPKRPLFDPDKYRPSTAESHSDGDTKARVAIALSGGGYRAALLHAGVLSAIEERKLPIAVEAMSTVSGGSIIGSFYATGGAPEEFLKAVINRRFNLKREILHTHVLSHLLLASRIIGTDWNLVWFLDNYNRTQVQSRMFDRLFLKEMLSTESQKEGRPELMVCLTDLAGAALVGITPKGSVRQPIGLPLGRILFDNYPQGVNSKGRAAPTFDYGSTLTLPKPEEERLSSLVAASGAFPGALKAYSPIGGENNSKRKKDTPLFSDGGILDNYGIILLYAAKKLAFEARQETANPSKDAPLKAWDVEFVIVSDGSAIEEDKQPRYSVGELLRAVDVMSAAAANQEILNAYFTPRGTKPPALALTPRNLCPGKTPILPNTESEESCLNSLIASNSLAPESLENIVKNISNTGGEQSLARKWLEDSTKSGGESLAKKEKQKALEVIVKQIKNCRDAFVETSTLNDQIEEQTARSIFLLGKYLVYLNENYIRALAKKFEGSNMRTETKSVSNTDQ